MVKPKIHFMLLKEKIIRHLCSGKMSTSKDYTNDYFQVTCSKCKNILELDILKIPVKKRSKSEHLILAKHYGGVRKYLLSMGRFKDVKI